MFTAFQKKDTILHGKSSLPEGRSKICMTMGRERPRTALYIGKLASRESRLASSRICLESVQKSLGHRVQPFRPL